MTYVGEVFHRHLGLVHERLADDEYGQPGLRGSSGAPLPLWSLVLETAARGDPGRLLALFEARRSRPAG